jgi:hypothetical protein
MYAVESPECWFEDFGEGTLANGVATVKLDPQFVQHIHTDDYHVFITPHDANHQLAATTRAGQEFTVKANAEVAKLNGKQLTDVNGTFSWRVVAKRNDIAGERLPMWDMPTPATIPDPPAFVTTPKSALPVPPSLPAVAPSPVPPSRPPGPGAGDASAPVAPIPAPAPTSPPTVGGSAAPGAPNPLPPSRP